MFLTDAVPVYEGYENFISCCKAIFVPLWDGLNSICIPGTDWSITGVFIALLTAGLIGKIMKHLFGTFGSHLDSGLRMRKKEEE